MAHTIGGKEMAVWAAQYKTELLDRVVPFWMDHSLDWEHGGYFTCLDRKGAVYDTDKFIWLQARQVWWFSFLYKQVEANPKYLAIAENGAKFLKKYGHDARFDWYFGLTQKGEPLIQPYNIFSNTFSAMAFGHLGLQTGNGEYLDLAEKTFNRVLERRNNPKGSYNKAYPGTRPLRNFALPMILCNLCLELEPLLSPSLVEQSLDAALYEVMDVFYNPEKGVVLENVLEDGTFSDSYDGRLLNPGHAIEAMWFIMDIAERRKDKTLMEKAVKITLDTLAHGWDQQYGGIFYFMDLLNKPPQQLEWDQKLWWVHLETLVSLLKGYQLTGNQDCLQWFAQVHEYTWSHFKDADHAGWFGYLNRQGQVLLPLKGGKWKGCFHVPRALYQCWKTLEKLDRESTQTN